MTETRQIAAPKFFVPLESLRGLAALVVVAYHAVWTNPVTALHFVQNGALMVDFFFVLSGFVIFHSYGRKLGSFTDIARFLWLRLGRLYPLHLAFLLVFFAFEVAKFIAERRFGIIADKPAFTINGGYSFVTNLLLIHSLGLHHSLTYNYPSWSISTEYYAYVLFAAVRSLFSNDRLFTAAAVVIVTISASILLWLDIVPLINAGYDWGFFRCCGGFFLGTLTYRVYAAIAGGDGGNNASSSSSSSSSSGGGDGDRRGSAGQRPSRENTAGDSAQRGTWTSWLSPVALLATIVFLCTADPEGRWTYALPLLSALVILTLVLWPRRGLQSLLSAPPLTWLGRVSYSLYMVHAAVVWVVTQILTVVLKFPKIELPDGHGVGTPPGVGLLVLAGYLVIVLVLSHFTYNWIEEPFRKRSRRLAQRWFPTDPQRLVVSPAKP